MAELESVMHRLNAQTQELRKKSLATGGADGLDDRALMVEGLALVSEALLKVGRDVRFLRLQLAEKA